MKRMTSLSLLLLTLLPVSLAYAEQPIPFTPPQLGAPEARVGGGTRGLKIANNSKQANNIQLLATKQIGLSSSATPTLYWYAPKQLSNDVKITVRSTDNKPLLEKTIGKIKSAGIQVIHLTDYGVSLVEGQDYTWSIATGSKVGTANATIRYTPSATALTDASQMAEAGYWYDAVSKLIETKSPQLTEFLQHEGINIKADK